VGSFSLAKNIQAERLLGFGGGGLAKSALLQLTFRSYNRISSENLKGVVKIFFLLMMLKIHEIKKK